VRKKMSSEEVKKTIIYQVEHTRMNTAKHQTPSREKHRETKHNRRTTARAREENRAKSMSVHPSNEEEDFV
jgi:hypothetical protein